MTDEKKIRIRLAEPKDKSQFEALWRYCFSDTDEFVNYYFSKRYDEKHALGLFAEGKLEAALQLNPYQLTVGEHTTDSSYVVGVSVWPQSRGKGYMTQLIKAAVAHQYKKGEEISILMPIDTRIYSRYGYVNCFDRHELVMDLSRIFVEKSDYRIERADLNESASMEQAILALQRVYDEEVKNHHAKIFRDELYWRNKLSELAVDGGTAFIAFDGNVPRGYLLLLPKPTEGIAVELAVSDSQAYNALMAVIKSHATQFSRVRITTMQEQDLRLMGRYDNQVEHFIKPFMMVRVIDAERVLRNILNKPEIFGNGRDTSVSMAIEVKDPMLERNNFVALLHEGELSILRQNEDFELKNSSEPLDGEKLQSINVESLIKNGDIFPELRFCRECEKTQSDLCELRLRLGVEELAQLYLQSATLSSLVKLGRVEIGFGTLAGEATSSAPLKKKSGYEELLKEPETVFGTKIAQNYINDYI